MLLRFDGSLKTEISNLEGYQKPGNSNIEKIRKRSLLVFRLFFSNIANHDFFFNNTGIPNLKNFSELAILLVKIFLIFGILLTKKFMICNICKKASVYGTTYPTFNAASIDYWINLII